VSAHLAIAPVLAPFLAGLALLALPRMPFALQRAVTLAAVLAQAGIALALLDAVAGGEILVYRLGGWAPPWGIVLVADRLAAVMVLTTTLLALCAAIHAGDGADRHGRHFHVLFQLQLFGLAGAFLTGDLFNLFVFFEVLLIASYGLLLHGGGAARTRAGLHYVVLNLLGSAVFLFAAGLLYATLGTLNLADLALKAAALPPQDAGLARAGGLLLLAVFALKAALLPLQLWLPAAYAATAAPVAALFAIMTKVGIYAILRTGTLLFGDTGTVLAGLFEPWLLPLGLATLAIGMAGALAAGSLRRLAAHLVVASAGTLLTASALGAAGIAAGLYYLPHGSFATAVLFLLADAIARRRPAGADRLAAGPDLPCHALWGALFLAAAVAAAGLPPLSGFIGKFLLLRAAAGQPLVWAVVLAGALLGTIALAGAGSRLFLASRADGDGTLQQALPFGDAAAPSARELLAVGGLLGLIVALTLGAGAVFGFAEATARQLLTPAAYIGAVLGAGP